MKNKLVCLALSILMVMSVLLTGCATNQTTDEEATGEDGTTEDTTGTRATMTLTLWLPTSENTTDEAIEAVAEAVNSVTKSKFKTSIELRLIDDKDYDAAIDERITYIEQQIIAEEEEAERLKEEAKKLKEQGITTEETEEESESVTTEEETVINDLGMTELKYPGVGDKQMDIFLVRGYDNYASYIERGALSGLDDELNGSSKILKSYIYPTFLEMAKEEGTTYAIPNNHVVGEYKFMLVNKELAAKYYYDTDTFTSLIKCEDFINTVGMYEPDVTPLLSEVDPVGMFYWPSGSPNEFTLLGAQIPNTASNSSKAAPRNIFAVKAFTDHYAFMRRLEEKGYIGDGTAENFAVGIVSGGADLIEKYEEDYVVTIYEKPRFEDADVYSAMFAVSSYTKDLARAMEIITFINTDPELRTILQYGVKGVHYDIDSETDLLVKLNDDYQMNLNETGNVYMTYPGEGQPMSDWEYGKQQNLDSISSPYMKFRDFMNDENEAWYEEMYELADEYWDRIEATPAEELPNLFSELKDEVDSLDCMVKLLDDGETYAASPAAIYNEWHTTNYPPAS